MTNDKQKAIEHLKLVARGHRVDLQRLVGACKELPANARPALDDRLAKAYERLADALLALAEAHRAAGQNFRAGQALREHAVHDHRAKFFRDMAASSRDF